MFISEVYGMLCLVFLQAVMNEGPSLVLPFPTCPAFPGTLGSKVWEYEKVCVYTHTYTHSQCFIHGFGVYNIISFFVRLRVKVGIAQ